MDRDTPAEPPFEQVRIYENALPARVFEDLRALVDKLPHAGAGHKENTGWWALRSPRTTAELVASFLMPRVEAPHLAGVEWWVRLACLDEEPDPHFDKDENRWEQTGDGEFEGEMVHPLYSSILYLGDEGGATVIVDQRAITEGVKIVALEPPLEDTEHCRAHVVLPEPNKFVIFPGWARHWVMAAEGEGSRRTLLFNWWTQEPWQMPTSPVLITGEKP